MAHTNRQYRLKSRPNNRVSSDNFVMAVNPAPSPGPGEALIKTLILSLDPTNRIWMEDIPQYLPPVKIGEVMRGLGIGQVVASRSEKFHIGDVVSGPVGWQEFSTTHEQSNDFFVLPKIDGVPIDAFAGVLGMTGMTAYFGLLDLGQPKPQETLVVSAAAGAVGSIVGQIGKIKGCRVVGIAGSDAKCAWLKDSLHFDAAINYKNSNWQQQLLAACPNGIDINFENVGGGNMNFILNHMNLHGRVILCGLISSYNKTGSAQGDFSAVLMKRLRVQGFIILDYLSRAQEAVGALAQWLASDKLKYQETIINDLQNAPEGLNMLFDGKNTGKLLVRVAAPIPR